MRILLFLFNLFFITNVFAAPDSSMSISPAAVDATTIAASDENTRNNSISSTYNAHDHNDIDQTANTLNIGDAAAGNKTITAYNADSNKPFIRYNDTSNEWIVSTDGSSNSVVLSGAGLVFEGATDDVYETSLLVSDPSADRTITFPDENGTVALLPNSTSPLIVSKGGTGAATLTGLVKGNGTSAFTAAVAGTDYQAVLSGPMVYGDVRGIVVFANYDLTTTSGNQTITGAGFAPTGVIVIANVDGGSRMSIGFSGVGLVDYGFNDLNGDVAGSYGSINVLISLRTASGTEQTGTITSFNSDGCVIAWTKTGSPTGTANLSLYFTR